MATVALSKDGTHPFAATHLRLPSSCLTTPPTRSSEVLQKVLTILTVLPHSQPQYAELGRWRLCRVYLSGACELLRLPVHSLQLVQPGHRQLRCVHSLAAARITPINFVMLPEIC
jgi:hypothetical protein